MRVYDLKELEPLIFGRQKFLPGRKIFKSLCVLRRIMKDTEGKEPTSIAFFTV